MIVYTVLALIAVLIIALIVWSAPPRLTRKRGQSLLTMPMSRVPAPPPPPMPQLWVMRESMKLTQTALARGLEGWNFLQHEEALLTAEWGMKLMRDAFDTAKAEMLKPKPESEK